MAPPKHPNIVESLIATGNHPVTHRMLFLGACEYGRAVWILAGHPSAPLVPLAHLACQTIELGLKSYLAFRGVDELGLKGIGHDLERARDECRAKGLEVQFPGGWLELFNIQYAHPFTYRYWREGLGASMPGGQKMVAETLLDVLRQISAATGDQDRGQLAIMAGWTP